MASRVANGYVYSYSIEIDGVDAEMPDNVN